MKGTIVAIVALLAFVSLSASAQRSAEKVITDPTCRLGLHGDLFGINKDSLMAKKYIKKLKKDKGYDAYVLLKRDYPYYSYDEVDEETNLVWGINFKNYDDVLTTSTSSILWRINRHASDEVIVGDNRTYWRFTTPRWGSELERYYKQLPNCVLEREWL